MFDQVITHNGRFSADDVFNVALCRILNPECKIIRTDDPKKHIENAGRLNPPDRVLLLYDEYDSFYYFFMDYGQLLLPTESSYDFFKNYFLDRFKKNDLLSDTIISLNCPPEDLVKASSEFVYFMRAVNIATIMLKGWIDTSLNWRKSK